MNARNPAVKTGQGLLNEISSTRVNRGSVAIWWLGQATFAIKLGETLIYTDPFYRAADQDPPSMQEMPLKPHEFKHANFICCTHEHLDHIDPLTLPGAAAASPLAPVIIPAYTRDFVLKMNVPAERLTLMRGDDSIERNGVKITAIPAAHMKLEKNDAGYRYLGYMIEANGLTIYHPGDTQPYEGWYERVSKFKIDIALLPISGVDNLHWMHATYFCALHRPKLAIPMHYGMFKGYSEDPLKFAESLANNVPSQAMKILQVGDLFTYQH
ncbi:MAG TPA: MBL fold metallo-hydrolase [Planctomycetota bacterium]|nr:MBL fold metallo-hydrolase [Planctomycetota bacterium]